MSNGVSNRTSYSNSSGSCSHLPHKTRALRGGCSCGRSRGWSTRGGWSSSWNAASAIAKSAASANLPSVKTFVSISCRRVQKVFIIKYKHCYSTMCFRSFTPKTISSSMTQKLILNIDLLWLFWSSFREKMCQSDLR